MVLPCYEICWLQTEHLFVVPVCPCGLLLEAHLVGSMMWRWMDSSNQLPAWSLLWAQPEKEPMMLTCFVFGVLEVVLVGPVVIQRGEILPASVMAACIARHNFRSSAGAYDACWTGLNSALEDAVSSTVRVNYEPGLLGAMPVARLVPAMLVEQVLGWLWASAVECNVCGSAGASGVAWSGRMASTIHLTIVVTEAGWCRWTVVMNSCVASPRSCLVLAM